MLNGQALLLTFHISKNFPVQRLRRSQAEISVIIGICMKLFLFTLPQLRIAAHFDHSLNNNQIFIYEINNLIRKSV